MELNDIQRIRKLTGLSQSKFSDLTGIPVSTIRQWERNGAKPPKYLVVMLEKVLRYEGNIDKENK